MTKKPVLIHERSHRFKSCLVVNATRQKSLSPKYPLTFERNIHIMILISFNN